MSRPRGPVGPHSTAIALNKENPSKTATPSASVPSRRPLQPCGNVIANRTGKAAPTKGDDTGEGASVAEQGLEEMPSKDFDALCFSCEDEEYWKQEIHNACEGLRDLNAQWSARMKCLARLRYLMMAKEKLSTLVRPQLTVLLAQRVREVLVIQLSDRRSVLLREACITIAAFSRLGDAAMGFFCDLLPALFKNLIITTKAIVDSSHKCILTWIRSSAVQSIAYLPLILDGLENQHPMLRARCAEYIAEMLEKDKAAYVLRDEGDRLEGALQKSLADGDGDVRAMARRAYPAFCTIWTERGQRIWTRLEYATQRQLEAERKERKANKGEKRELESTPAPQTQQTQAAVAPAQRVPLCAVSPAPIAAAATAVALPSYSRVLIAPSGSPTKRARVAEPVAPSLNLSRSISLAATASRMLRAVPPTQPRPSNT